MKGEYKGELKGKSSKGQWRSNKGKGKGTKGKYRIYGVDDNTWIGYGWLPQVTDDWGNPPDAQWNPEPVNGAAYANGAAYGMWTSEN